MSKLRRWTTLLVLAAVLAGCGGTPEVSTSATVAPAANPTATTAPIIEPAAEPTTDSTPEVTAEAQAENTPEPTLAAQANDGGDQSDEEIETALQETVDLWNRAYAEANHDLLLEAIDPKASTLRRILADQLDASIQSQGSIDRDAQVADFERRANGYILAHVDVQGRFYTFTFKEVGGKWLLSEPRREELGKKKTIESEHIRLEYYPWDDDVAPQIAEMLEEAHTFVVEKLGRGPQEKTRVQLNAIGQLARSGGLVLASYQTGSTRRARVANISINSPNSFQGGRYDREAGWQQQMTETLNHEYVHLVHDCCFTNLFLQATWMIEGLAVYVTEGGHTNGYMSYVTRAVQNDAILPIRAPSTGSGKVPKHLEAFDTLNEAETLTAYGLSATLVDYIVTNHGGMDGFWKLATDFEQSHDINTSVQNVFGISLEELETGWRKELMQRYGG
jgi:hypothetical protein